METRANYVMIGTFVVAVLVAAFLSIFWLAASADSRQSVNVKVIFPGPVTGLPVGGQVLFNGIKVGDVSALDFDPRDPNIVIATIRVSPTVPLRKNVRATVGFQGLTGVAYVDLKGGTTNVPLLIQPGMKDEPVIYADRSFFDDILENGQEVVKRADATLKLMEGLLEDNKDDVTKTVHNVQVFSQALADNASGVDQFMASVGSATKAFTKLSDKMEGLVDEGQRILAAVPSDKVEQVAANIEHFTASLDRASGQMDQVIANATKASEGLKEFSDKLNSSMDSMQAVVAEVKPEDVRQVMAAAKALSAVVEKRSQDLDQIVMDSRATMDNVRQVSDMVRKRSDDISNFIATAESAASQINKAAGNVTNVIDAVNPDRVSRIVASVDSFTTNLSGQSDKISATVASAQSAAATIEHMSADLSKRTPDVNAVISNAKETSENLNAASKQVQALLKQVSSFVDADGQGFLQEATKAATSIRKVADIFESRAGGIADGLSKFANQGSTQFGGAMTQLNRTLIAIQRAAENFDRDPNRVIFGGGDVPRYNGAQRR